MTKLQRLMLALAACISASFASPALADMTLVIVRHGEKPPMGLGQLSCQGLNRALALPQVLLEHYGRPAAIYAPNPAIKKSDKGKLYPYIRPLATIEPFAIRVGQPVNLDWGLTDISSLAEHLLSQADGTYVIAWEHHYGKKLAELLLGALKSPANVPDWEDADFDSIYVIRITGGDKEARQATFAREQEGLNGLPETCGTGPMGAR